MCWTKSYLHSFNHQPSVVAAVFVVVVVAAAAVAVAAFVFET